MPSQITEALEDFSVAAQDLLAATYDTFQDAARRLADLLTVPALLGRVADETLADVDFISWYDAQAATQGSFVGSGRLDWPRDPKERLAMQLALFRALGAGRLDVLEFCYTFLWASNKHDDNVRNFLDQIARPFLRDFERHVRRLDQLQVEQTPIPRPREATLAERLDVGRATPMADPQKIFVVYGRDEKLRRAMFDFLRAIGLVPLEWTQAIALTGQGSPYVGEVIETAFGLAQAILVVFSPDDEVRLSPDLCTPTEDSVETTLGLQPRPNVLFEAGMAFGSKPDRTILVEVGGVKRFSDVAGRHAVRLNNSPERRLDLVNRLQSAGCSTNVIGTDWLSLGDFEITREASGAAAVLSPSAAPTPSVRYVDLAYPKDAGIVAALEADGKAVRWCSDDRLARALDIDGWELVRRTGDDGREFIIKMHDVPFEQTLVSKSNVV